MGKIINCLYILLIMNSVSCTMEKRLYSSGYNINWKHNSGGMDITQDSSLQKNKENVSSIPYSKYSFNKSLNNVVKNQEETLVLNNIIKGQVYPKGNKVLMNSKENLRLREEKKQVNSKKYDKYSLLKKFKSTKSSPEPRRREMHLLTKISLILIGIGLLLLIISFWTWYFSFLSDIGGVSSGVSGSYMFLISGLGCLALGLLLLIFRWITS